MEIPLAGDNFVESTSPHRWGQGLRGAHTGRDRRRAEPLWTERTKIRDARHLFPNGTPAMCSLLPARGHSRGRWSALQFSQGEGKTGVSIQLCSHCKSPYWRFRGDHPPKGFCQVSCRDEKLAGKKRSIPPLPENALRSIMEHRRERHQCTDILMWFECIECEALEKVYAEAIEYHYDRITRELVGAGRKAK